MRRAHLYLVGIVLLNIADAILVVAESWLYMPDGDEPVGIRLARSYGYLPSLLVLIFLWCRTDAAERRIEVPFGVSMLLSLLFPIGVPYYFFRTYPLARAFAHIGWAITFVAICFGTASLAFRLTFHYLATAA